MATIQADSCVDVDLTEAVSHTATVIGGTTPQPQMTYIPPTGETITGISVGPSGRMHTTTTGKAALDSQLPGGADVSGTFRITNVGTLTDNNNLGRLVRCDANLQNFLWPRLNINTGGAPVWQLVQTASGIGAVIGTPTAVVSPATSDFYDVTWSVAGTAFNASYTKNGGGSPITLFGGAVTVSVVAAGRAGIKGDGVETDATGLAISALTLTGTAPAGTMSLSPTTGTIGTTATVTFTGVGTAWNGFTKFVDLTGGITFTGITVSSPTSATATAHYNSGSGAHTIGDTFDVGTATITLAAGLTLTGSAPAVVDGGTVSLTAIGTGSIAASVSGGGTLSTATPTTAVPFTYTAPPSPATGTATVSVSNGGSPVTKTIFYGPRQEWCEVGIASPTSVTAQAYDTANNAVGPAYGPLAALAGPSGEYGVWAVFPDATNTYRVAFDDGRGTSSGGVFVSAPPPPGPLPAGEGTIVAGTDATHWVVAPTTMGTGSCFNRRRLVITGPISSSSYLQESEGQPTQSFASGVHTFTFPSAQQATPNLGDVVMLLGY